MVYGYCRVSTKHQRITRQVTNSFPEYRMSTDISSQIEKEEAGVELFEFGKVGHFIVENEDALSSSSFQIWFDVVANAGSSPQELGVSEIALYESADQQSWTRVQTYLMADYTQMVDQDTTYHGGYVPYDTAITGYYYRARITFYAKNSRGVGELDVYTEIIRM